MTTVRLRPSTEADLVERTQHYRSEGGDQVGVRFFDAAIASLRGIGRMPGAGSPRTGELCDIPGLRVRRVPGFPVGWFYFVRQVWPTPSHPLVMIGGMTSKRSTQRRTICPECRSAVRPILFGMPSREMFAAADRGEVFLGGCCVPMISGATERCACGATSFDRAGNRVLAPLHAVGSEEDE